jgi:hypothetical protein
MSKKLTNAELAEALNRSNAGRVDVERKLRETTARLDRAKDGLRQIVGDGGKGTEFCKSVARLTLDELPRIRERRR